MLGGNLITMLTKHGEKEHSLHSRTSNIINTYRGCHVKIRIP